MGSSRGRFVLTDYNHNQCRTALFTRTFVSVSRYEPRHPDGQITSEQDGVPARVSIKASF